MGCHLKVYDITRTIHEGMAVYKNIENKRPKLEVLKTHEIHHMQEGKITLELHTGTHADAPLHMIEGGTTIDQLSPELFMGDCIVIDLTAISGSIGWEDLENKGIQKNDIVLLKTKSSYQHDFDPEFVYVSASAAIFLTETQVKGVGIDALGIERDQPNHDTHKLLFESGAFIVEGLALREVPSGRYEFIGLPLKLQKMEGSPIRAILIDR